MYKRHYYTSKDYNLTYMYYNYNLTSDIIVTSRRQLLPITIIIVFKLDKTLIKDTNGDKIRSHTRTNIGTKCPQIKHYIKYFYFKNSVNELFTDVTEIKLI